MRSLPHAFFVFLLILITSACGSSRERGRADGGVIPGRDAGTPGLDAGTPGRDAGGAFGYCPGFEPGGVEACRVDADCACGACTLGSICGDVGCASECVSDADCFEGWCSTGCCSFCVPACPGTPCGEGSTCDAASGRCVPVTCTEGFECPTNTRCDPGTGADARGCRRLDCTADTDCDCGTCAQGRCWDRPGQCCPPLPG